ncbi:MAG: 30S ribosomal protein S12 methylthiotransferase RimO [Bacteroidia bacterium]|jgi:ribosomal protein S12 methylthiotransferase|nr:30S ribosomal protein S12 methylthiotransferase RimO [Bacteroidia bacterium]MBP6010462.1 30S ribosomal protein S12 methylthiotransferase RimO [Bacteroidia bacterium]MBP7270859.1 30S ribosomal protein S12 methylthiotransferase RimO [Bacteroidia bacterium]MBP7438215.1 30S ribosomal protein S12 methylthiotransferase RimO [Bacteroidia bacterium]HRI41372.1 30S ribosomal protein S12 methylthiotransferase RimO [Bacteroidia bacterium]
MRTKSLKKNKVNVITLGCSKNIYDSEVLMGQLSANKFDVVHESTEDDAAIVIINTCGFIDNAKQESIDTILAYAQAREAGKIEKLIVTGCLSERYKPELEKEIGNVDGFFGTRDLPRLLKSLGADYKHELIGERLLTTPAHYAYLKISEGCDRPCSFCAIPLMRGKHASVPKEQLVEQARLLASKGTRELILIAQDLTYYGLDLYGKRELADLIRQLAAVDGIRWIRLHYAFPSGFPMEVLDIMRELPNVCNYIDIPLQHIADPMLKSMRRGITREKTVELVKEMRERVPGIAIRTTLITGYPGETEKDFEAMREWVRETRFDRLGVFTYSHEENTHAFRLTDDVPEEIKRERAEAIMAVQQEISAQKNQELVGRILPVLIDRKEGNHFIGRTEYDSPEVDNEVLIDAREHFLRIGDFTTVRIIRAEEFDLYAEPVGS